MPRLEAVDGRPDKAFACALGFVEDSDSEAVAVPSVCGSLSAESEAVSAPVTLSGNVEELRLAMETETGSSPRPSERSNPDDYTSWCPKCRLQSTMLEWCSHCNRCLLDGVSSSGYRTSSDSELQRDALRSCVDSESDSGLQHDAPKSSADAESYSQWPDVESVSSSSGWESAALAAMTKLVLLMRALAL